MCNDHILQNINDAIQYIEQRERNNVDINSIYDNICNIYYNEMDSKLKYFDSRSPKRARRTLKPWWNEDLTSLFDQYRISEKLYLKCSYRIEKSRLLLDFRKKRKLLDKFYNKAKRQYKEDVKIGIAESETKKP